MHTSLDFLLEYLQVSIPTLASERLSKIAFCTYRGYLRHDGVAILESMHGEQHTSQRRRVPLSVGVVSV
jgi:hypothetical protein